MDELSFLEADPAVEPTPAPAAEAAPDAPAAEGPARGPDGKFIAASPDPAPAAAAPVATAEPATPAPPAPAAQTPPDGFVPIAVVQEMRRELQALKQPPTPAAPPPDPFEDPDGYQAHWQQEALRERFSWSHRLALQAHGEETVNNVMTWAAERADSDPAFMARSNAHPDPVKFAFEEYQREQALQLFADPATRASFLAWQAAQAGQPQPAAAQAQTPAAPPSAPTPPRSLASEPNAGGGKPGAPPTHEGAAYEALFQKG